MEVLKLKYSGKILKLSYNFFWYALVGILGLGIIDVICNRSISDMLCGNWILATVCSTLLIITSIFTKIKLKNIDVRKNVALGAVCLAISGAFFWCIPAYFNDTSKYDFEWQPLLMSIFSILCFIAFIFFAVTFFRGKNILMNASFFVFCPVLWFALSLILFLSIYNNHANIVEVSMTAMLALFFVYHTQVFSTSSKANITKLMFIFGMPSVILICSHCIPVMINYFHGNETATLTLATCTLKLLIAVYIALHIHDAYRQIEKADEPEVKSVSIN